MAAGNEAADVGRWSKAKRHFDQAVKLASGPGANPLDLVDALLGLAEVLQNSMEQCQLTQAETCCRGAGQIVQAELGEKHVRVAEMLEGMADICQTQAFLLGGEHQDEADIRSD
jgi:hypothetical protein